MWKTLALASEVIVFLGAIVVSALWARLAWVMHKAGQAFVKELAEFRARNLPGGSDAGHSLRDAGATGTYIPVARHRVSGVDARRFRDGEVK